MPSNNESASDKPKRDYYDADKLKAIPITEVCEHFGIRIDYKAREPRCSIRANDKHPSTVLHTDPHGRFDVNTYHDFGTNESGDVISLTCKLLGLDRSNKHDRYQAMQYLGNAFQISPENKRNQNPGELSDREYRTIGLYGDRATKNFQFDPDHQSIERMSEISRKYDMTMNELKKIHPRIFERLLKTIAFPRLIEGRNNYYLDIWSTRRFLRSVMGEQATITDMKEFDQAAEELRSMERILIRAVKGTQLKPPTPADYDIGNVLARIDSGELKPSFGSKTYNQMKRLAEAQHTNLKFKTLELPPVLYRGEEIFRNIPYSAFLSNGNAVVRYLEKDSEALVPIFVEFGVSKAPLNDKVKNAKRRQPPVPAKHPNGQGLQR